MEAYNDVLFSINSRQIVIESCTNELYVSAPNNFNLIENSYDLSDFITPEDVMNLLKNK